MLSKCSTHLGKVYFVWPTFGSYLSSTRQQFPGENSELNIYSHQFFVTFKSTAKYRGRARMQFTKKAKWAKWAKRDKNVSFMLSSESKHVLQHTQHALISKKKWTGEVYICSYKVMIYQSFLIIFYFCSGYLMRKKTCIQRSNVHQSMISNVYDLFNLNSLSLAGVQSQTRGLWCHKGRVQTYR